MRRRRIFEGVNHIFDDDETGKSYIVQNGLFVEISKPDGPGGDPGDPPTGGGDNKMDPGQRDAMSQMAYEILQQMYAEGYTIDVDEDGNFIDDDAYNEFMRRLRDKITSGRLKQSGGGGASGGVRSRADFEHDAEMAKRNIDSAKDISTPTGESLLSNLQNDLSDFVNSIAQEKQASRRNYRVQPKSYRGSNIFPGRTQHYTKKLNNVTPHVVVYQDVSGSFGSHELEWTDTNVLPIFKLALDDGLLTVEQLYFASRVSANIGNTGGGTSMEAVLGDIRNNLIPAHPEDLNVVLITDADFDGCSLLPPVDIPGYVWYVAVGREAACIPNEFIGEAGYSKYYFKSV